ncbi:MAG TPA: efflux RND transporter periplasmic adaptor subunit [Candidatus Methylacidiphilales bacterium]|jgi:macrolide-specific efflux system membrane fusion protein|nr:efflux RND transporter periplasmic adaptor subunit [Candidatus Methylacidiphilales bacterium]
MKRTHNLKWKYPALAVCLLLAAGVIAWLVFDWYADQPSYEYIKVGRGPLRVTLRESADIEPEHRLTVTPPIPGRIDSIEVANGADVKQGQILAWISSTDRAALMDAARAAGGKEVKFWEDIYKPAPLIAPLDGHIISTAVVPGQVVVTAETVFTMSDHLIVQADVDETDLNNVSLGQPVDITFDSYPNARLTGKVHEIAYDATTVNNVTTYLVNIFLDSTPSYVRSGLDANAFLLISDRKNVLRIPTDAITPEGDVLLVPGPDQPLVPRRIKVGMSDGTWTEVVSGLNEGDWIARRVFTVGEAEKNGFSFLPGNLRRMR